MNYCYTQVKLCIVLVFFSILCVRDLNAQQNSTIELSPEVMAWTISTMEPWPPGKYNSVKEALIDNKIFPPLVFRGGLFPKMDYKFSRDSLRLTDFAGIPSPFAFLHKKSSPLFDYYLFRKSLNDRAYKKLLDNPSYFKYSVRLLPETIIKPESIDKSKDFIRIDVKSSTPPIEKIDPVIKFIPDRKYWTSTFAADIKFSQNKTSANWHKGEINNMTIYTNTNTTYNYSRNKVSLTNELTTNFTINNAPNDTLRKYTIGTDELRFRSNFGLKAIGNWNYSSSGEFNTSMGNKYIANKEIKNAAFLSPYTITLGLGMTYAVKPKFKTKDRSVDFSLSLEPLAFKYMHSKDRDINLAAYFPKNEDGNYKRFTRTFGSTITMNQTTKFNSKLALKTRFNYFTNYERVTGEFENKLDIILSRYFSTTIHIFLRYDDSVKKVEGSDTYLQVNETFSFGFSYRW